MDKTYQTKLRRVFLIKGLPEPLTPASRHLQIFDNYLENTRLRLRSIRVPEENKWTYILQQSFPLTSQDLSVWKSSEIYLNDFEYQTFERFKGREIRKNRYFHEFGDHLAELDIYLGKLWGLNMLTVEFETKDEMKSFELPEIVFYEVTNAEFYTGASLVEKNFADVQAEFNH